jgi:S-methylmethionine-dependent homocysteine/selenocysteine methylase
MLERIRRDPAARLDPFIAHAGLIYDPAGRAILDRIYREYIDIARSHDLPMMTYAPTWRANPDNLEKSAYRHHRHINAEAVDFLDGIRGKYADYSRRIFIGGLMACQGNAYRPQEALSPEAAAGFHRRQAEALAKSRADFIKAATLPAVSEARGIATAISAQGLPYILSFVVRPDGSILDGTPIWRGIELIDSETHPRPLFYMVNCVHPHVFELAVSSVENLSRIVTGRVRGLQANTSAKSPEELDNLSCLDTSPPEEFGRIMVALQRKFGLKVLGGCCGTDARHMSEIAKRLFS